MHDEHRDLANKLFSAATAHLENAFDAALAGGSANLTEADCLAYADRLQAAARGLSAIALAIISVLPTPRPGSSLHEAADRPGLGS